MGRLASDQSGFNIVEAIVVVAIVGLVGTAGWFIYQHDRTKVTHASSNGTPPATANQTSTTPSSAQTGATLDIKEWGVHMTLDSTTASMYYYINPQLPNVAYVSLRTISAIAPSCAADKMSLGAISRLTPEEHQSALNNPAAATAGTIQIGNYWYGFSAPQSSCIDSTTTDAVTHALPKYTAGTVANTFNTLATD